MSKTEKKGLEKDTRPSEDSKNKPDEAEGQAPQIYERPRICAIDLEEKCIQALKSRGFNYYSGTLGPVVKVPNTERYSEHRCLLNLDFPPNLHEYDIIVIDLQSPLQVEYIEKDNTRTQTKGHKQLALVSAFPQTIFDPRALSASILGKRLRPFMVKESIIVVFGAEHEEIEYHPVSITQRGESRGDTETYSLYDFFPDLPLWKNIMGIDTAIIFKEGGELRSLLERHNDDATYRIAFEHPTHWNGKKYVKNDNFIRLIEAKSGSIVSFANIEKGNFTFLFPQIKHKEVFLIDLLEKVLSGIIPSLFPYSTQFAWLTAPLYRLPNETELMGEKKKLKDEYQVSLKELEAEIDTNRQEYGYLHDLLNETGSKLVKAVENYLAWLGFENVVNVDETDPEIKEEDLRIENDRGLLVIEAKGIGGTSTDSDCSQIHKIKYRRSKERGAFDVFGLYLVNHQRYLSPEKRMNPPFNETQIQDARNDERGLLTTYELFKLYFNVSEGYISKEDARKALYQTGLVEFWPSRAIKIPTPFELLHKGHVIVFRSDGITVKEGMSAILCDSGRCRSAKILEIQVEGQSVKEADSGEIGIRLSEKILKTTQVWLRAEA